MSDAPPADGTHVEVDTDLGTIRGRWSHDVMRFVGIPYAAPPVGERRYRPPAPAEPWDGVRPAEDFGPICPQNPSMMDLLYGGDSERYDEDCLYLNVWTPALPETGGSAKPVMVWLHGGGFEMGSGSSPLYDGTHFARSGVVIVTVNYRLGSLGFLELGHLDPELAGSGNVGLLDQIAALEWVQRNVANFGGDPDNVTVFGQSAGAMSTSLIMATGRAPGLFSRAIVQSGAANAARTPEAAHHDADDFLTAGGWTTAAEVATAPVADLLAAHAAMSSARLADPESFIQRAGTPLGFLPFRPVADGTIVPADPLAAIANGAAAGVDLLCGTTSQEWRLFSLMVAGPSSEDDLKRRLSMLVTDPDAALAAYLPEYAEETFADVDGAVLTDMVFRAPTVHMADAQRAHATVHQYLWDWRSDAFGGLIGAAHAIEIPFVFDLLEDQRLHVFVGADAPRELARRTNEAWIAFATDGTPTAEGLPKWPALGTDDGRPVMVLTTKPYLADDPNGGTRRFWATAGSAMPPRGESASG